MMRKRINNWLNAKVEPKESVKHGMGIFAIEKISKDEVVAVFGGKVMTRQERNNLPEEVSHLALGIDSEMFIGPTSKDMTDDAEWFNHSCEPNCGIFGQIMLVAMRDIEVGEEVTFDYCMTCSQFGEKRVLFECDCSSKNCRKEVTNHDWRIELLQQKYKGYFSCFVQRNIENQANNG